MWLGPVAGGWATFCWLLLSVGWWACPGMSAAALGPGPALVGGLSSVPAFLSRRGR